MWIRNQEIHFAFVATDQENDLTSHVIRKQHHPTMSPALSFSFFLSVYLHRPLMLLEHFFVCLISKAFIIRLQRKITLLMLLHLFLLFTHFSFGLSLCIFFSVFLLRVQANLWIPFVHRRSFELGKDWSIKSYRTASEIQNVLGVVAYPKEFCPLT